VRRLAAVESLGATTVICADKTGTLTENRMAVHAWYVDGREVLQADAATAAPSDPTLARALTIAALCNEAELSHGGGEVSGSSTEGALLAAAHEGGVDYRALRTAYRLVAGRPRLNGENWMATVHARDGWQLTAVKGACEAVLARTTRVMSGDEPRPLDDETRQQIRALEARVAARGLRVLGLALKETAPNGEPSWDDLVWVGLVALTDPVRPGVREAIAACRRAGIRTVMLTGDHAQTAVAVARELGLGTRVVESAELAGADAARLAQLAAEADVFARVSPAHKYQIVRALQSAGHVVAMTGDGINDAAALRAADIGVAMGARGTDLARDVADVVLLDDDFGALVRAVEQGRAIHTNVGRSLRFLLSTNFSEILVTLGALAFAVPRPLSAIQLLWINLLSDVAPALALAIEPADHSIMDRPPRDPAASILPRAALGELAGESALLTAAALGAQAVGLARYGAGPHATALTFSTLTSAQLVHALRYRSTPADGRSSSWLTPVVAASLGTQVLAMLTPPLRRMLGLAPPATADWLVVAAGALAPAAVNELRRRAALTS
jgi:Ca2+-transporting ATPase